MVFSYVHHRLLIAFSLLSSVDYAIPLKLLELRVPTYVLLGSQAQLSCRWQLGPVDALYSVKWYKDGKEFFRHTPREEQATRTFPLPGVTVEKSDPTGASIVLSKAVMETSGRYRCEVTGERPLFPTVFDHADMEVVGLPTYGPMISRLRPRYRVGDRIYANCSAGRPKPSSHLRLSWYINGRPPPVEEESTLFHHKHEDQTPTTAILLDYEVTYDNLKEDCNIKVKCLATLATVYWRSAEETALLVNGNGEPILETCILDDLIHSNLAQIPASSLNAMIILLTVLYAIK